MSQELERKLMQFELQVQRHQVYASYEMAQKTLDILELCVRNAKTADEIETELIHATNRLQRSMPLDMIVYSFCSRVIDILNETLNTTLPFQPVKHKTTTRALSDIRRSQSVSLLEIFSTPTLIPRSNSDSSDFSLRDIMLEEIENLKDEIPQFHQRIARYATDYIHEGDLLMTLGDSKSVLIFLKQAAATLKFHVLVPERAPVYDGNTIAKKLREAGVSCTVIPDSAVFSVMPRVTTVFAPVRSIYADGTLITLSFTKTVAMAARYYSKPFVVLYWKWKLTDRVWTPVDPCTELTAPSDIECSGNPVGKIATIVNPEGEYIPSNLVTLFINEEGPHGPDDIFQLVHTLYNPTD